MSSAVGRGVKRRFSLPKIFLWTFQKADSVHLDRLSLFILCPYLVDIMFLQMYIIYIPSNILYMDGSGPMG